MARPVTKPGGEHACDEEPGENRKGIPWCPSCGWALTDDPTELPEVEA